MRLVALGVFLVACGDNTKPEAPGVAISAVNGLTTSEAGGQATFTVALTTRPHRDVTIALSSSDATEGTLTPASVTFTPLNWDAPQLVTVSGVDDAAADGPQDYVVVTAAAVSDDLRYVDFDAADVSLTNIDDETSGITVTPTSGLTTTEAGGQATFTVVLNSMPSADVTIDLTSNDETEGTVSPDRVTFTALDWNAPQTVTVTGVGDDEADASVGYAIVTSAATSSDVAYDDLDASDVEVRNIDDDSPGITVTPTSGLTTTEAGGQATFTVVLNSQPTDVVTIALVSDDEAEGTVSPGSVTFTPDDWNAPQTVTVQGVDDEIADGGQPYTVVTTAAASRDPGYVGRDAEDVVVINTDDDSPGITVTPTSGLTTTELGGQATFTIVLNSQPTADVTLDLVSSDLTEGTVSPDSVTFTTANWSAPRTITVTGENDVIADGNQPYTIRTSAASSDDAEYDGDDPPDVTVTNIDNDSPGITVSPTTGVTTTEAGGQATFTVVLNSQPAADVTMALASTDLGEGTVSTGSLTFTPGNWNAPRTVTVTGVDDDFADGNQLFLVQISPAVSTDVGYLGLNPADVSVSNTDNDSAGVTVTPTGGLVTTEAGGQATFTLVLNSRPTADVTIGLTSSDTTEGTVGPASVTFTPANWNAPRTVTVTGVNDAFVDSAQPYVIVTEQVSGGDPAYSAINPANVNVTNTDNDSPGITVSPTSGLVTTEAGGQATFTIVLNSQPSADVTVGLTSSAPTEGTVSIPSVTFTMANWNAPRTITVTGVNDTSVDSDQPYVIDTAQATSTDAAYAAINPANVSVTNTDNDSAGITVSPTSGLVTAEAGGQATFTVVLNSQPSADVTIGLTSNDLTEGTLDVPSLTFTAVNWNAPRTVTVTGQNDVVADGDQPYTIVTAQATSTDLAYAVINPANVSVSNTDNDSGGITVTPTGGLVTTEVGGQATFTIVLNSQPSADVTIGLTSNDTTEGTVSPASVTFTMANWNAPRTVTVTGVNDLVADSDQPYTIVTAQATSTDLAYAVINPANVSVSNTDDDSAGVTVTPTSGLVTTEAGGQATFTVVLNSQPTGNVSIGLSSSDTTEGTIDTTLVVFTSVSWNAPRTVTVTGVNDVVVDGDQPYVIVTEVLLGDAAYMQINPANVSVTNTDNDSAGITVTPTTGLVTTEAGGQATFTIVLNSQPTGDVTVGLSSSDTTEGTVSIPSVTFTPANWNAPRTVTVTGVNDPGADNDQPYTIDTAQATSTDAAYALINPANVSVTNTDNDSAGITVTPTTGLVTTEAGGQATFTIVLNSQPTADVTVVLTSNDTTEGTVDPTSVTFTSVSWAAPQLVTVTGVNDAGADGDQPYVIVTAQATSGDAAYAAINPADVAVSNTDNDSAGVTVTPTSGLVTTEAGAGEATFEIVLNSQPAGDVTIGLTSSDTTEGTVGPASVTFTNANWAAPQTVTVTGVNDAAADSDQPYTIVTAQATGGDPAYALINPADVSVTNTDDDSSGVTVDPTSGLITSEAGGEATFTVVLNSQPTANVTIALVSNDTTEGVPEVPSITFTSGDWFTPQTVTVTGVPDAAADGNQIYSIVTTATSADGTYNGITVADVGLTNTDAGGVAGITIDPIIDVTTSEFLTTDTFTVVLNSQPSANVTINLTSSDTTEGTVTPSVTFTTLNWNLAQTVTVTGVDDGVPDGNQTYQILTSQAVSTDAAYAAINPPNVDCLNVDNETAQVFVRPSKPLRTSEDVTLAEFTMQLTIPPTANVTCNVTSSDTTEATLSTASVVFTPANGTTPITVTVTGVDDAVNDGQQKYNVITASCSSTDGRYNNVNPKNPKGFNADND